MKKKIFLVSAVALLGLGAFFVSCTKKTCVCTTSDNVSQSKLQSDLDKALNSLALFDDCTDVESKMRGYGYRNIECH